MRLLVPKPHQVINSKIIIGALVFFFLYAMTVNKDVIPLPHSSMLKSDFSNLEVLQNMRILYQLRASNEEKEKTLAKGIHESPKPVQ